MAHVLELNLPSAWSRAVRLECPSSHFVGLDPRRKPSPYSCLAGGMWDADVIKSREDWLEQAVHERDVFASQIDLIETGKNAWLFPVGFTRDSWLGAMKKALAGLNSSLADFGR